MYSVVFFFFFFLSVILPSEILKLTADSPLKVFPTVWKHLLHDSLRGQVSTLNPFCLSFCLLYFVLPPFKENGLPFWVPGVLHQCLEVVL